jgi:amidase
VTDSAEGVWIERFDGVGGGGGPLVAVKDLIDVVGSVTTAGCPAVAERNHPATTDAACIRSVRAGGGRLAGKANLHELAFGTSGVNPWFGTPANPADPGRVPGGSSSGSAVAVALGEADIALGSDTGGSIRIPAACCGVVGLKTTFGLVPVEGVFPLAPSYDTVGPLAANVARTIEGLRLLVGEPDEEVTVEPRLARATLGPDVEIDPVIDAAVDEALRLSEIDVRRVDVDRWHEAWRAQQVLLGLEAVATDQWLIDDSGGQGMSAETLERFSRSRVEPDAERGARAVAAAWTPAFRRLVDREGFLALPTLCTRPPAVGERVAGFNLLTAPVNLAGLPAVSIPVPTRHTSHRPPTGLQLVGPPGGEEQLLALAARVEAAVAR